MAELPVLRTERLLLKILNKSAAVQVLDYYQRNRAFHQPWFAERPDQIFTIRQQEQNLAREYEDFQAGRAVPFWIFLQSDPERIIGRVAFTSIVRGCFDSCFLAYHLDQACQGRGLAQEAAQAAIALMFRDFKLHRIEANIMPANSRSLVLAEHLGFQLEGLSRQYLKINGKWEDHLHYVLLAGASGSPATFAAAAAKPAELAEIESESLLIRSLQPSDLNQAVDYYVRNRAFIEAWNPAPAADLTSLEGWQWVIASSRRDLAASRRLLLGMFLKDRPTRLIGFIDFQAITPLPYSSCEIGFSIDQLLSGRGLMFEALSAAIGYVYARFALRRFNASCVENNQRCLRLLELLGFAREGLSRQAVYLNDAWRDVIQLALLPADFHPASG
jgi:[ribosomal protein S5]-alanine N-acetyltransferase